MSPPVTWNAVSPSSQAMTMMAPMSASMSLLRRRTCILAGRRARQPAARAVGRTTLLRRSPILGAAHGALHSRSRREVTVSEEHIAYALRQVEQGTPAAELCRKLGISE